MICQIVIVVDIIIIIFISNGLGYLVLLLYYVFLILPISSIK